LKGHGFSHAAKAKPATQAALQIAEKFVVRAAVALSGFKPCPFKAASNCTTTNLTSNLPVRPALLILIGVPKESIRGLPTTATPEE